MKTMSPHVNDLVNLFNSLMPGPRRTQQRASPLTITQQQTKQTRTQHEHILDNRQAIQICTACAEKTLCRSTYKLRPNEAKEHTLKSSCCTSQDRHLNTWRFPTTMWKHMDIAQERLGRSDGCEASCTNN